MQTTWKLFDTEIGLNRPLFLIAGPCVIESKQLAIDTAGYLKEITDRLGINFIYKSSYDKANRSSDSTFRGPGIDNGLKILSEVKSQLGLRVLTDVHELEEIDQVAEVADNYKLQLFYVARLILLKQ
jgi:2-dehydro-3-deoxyphosphooctonate aldolase (KDO 8-P synthase)